eukprot:TRINITY_DN50940_c0_g1_i1.p1 TRINITY_DN50940_c0_g1~~TRINITY_DN50940_c0_g1_i1.p1  ORF type:complete len:753 (+),score=223.33 TRINITY_DN50940_c0_g1_i1:94-2259(+)
MPGPFQQGGELRQQRGYPPPEAVDRLLSARLLRYLHGEGGGLQLRELVRQAQEQLNPMSASGACGLQKVTVCVTIDVTRAAALDPELGWHLLCTPATVSRSLGEVAWQLLARYYAFPIPSGRAMTVRFRLERLPLYDTVPAHMASCVAAAQRRHSLFYKNDPAALRRQPPQLVRFSGFVAAVTLKAELAPGGCAILVPSAAEIASLARPGESSRRPLPRRTVRLRLNEMPAGYGEELHLGEAVSVIGYPRTVMTHGGDGEADQQQQAPCDFVVLSCAPLVRPQWPLLGGGVKAESGDAALRSGWERLYQGVSQFADWLVDGPAEAEAAFAVRAALLAAAASTRLAPADERGGRAAVHLAVVSQRALVSDLAGYVMRHCERGDSRRSTRPLAPSAHLVKGGVVVAGGALTLCHEGVLCLPRLEGLRKKEAAALTGVMRRQQTLTKVERRDHAGQQRYAAPCRCTVIGVATPQQEVPHPSCGEAEPDNNGKNELWLQQHVAIEADLLRAFDLVLLDREPQRQPGEDAIALLRQLDAVLHAFDVTDAEFTQAAEPPLHSALRRLLGSAPVRAPPVSAEAARLLQGFYVATRRRRTADACVSVELLHGLIRVAGCFAVLLQGTAVEAAHALLSVALAEHSLAAKTGKLLVPLADKLLFHSADPNWAAAGILGFRDAIYDFIAEVTSADEAAALRAARDEERRAAAPAADEGDEFPEAADDDGWGD